MLIHPWALKEILNVILVLDAFFFWLGIYFSESEIVLHTISVVVLGPVEWVFFC